MSEYVSLTNVPVRALVPPLIDFLAQHGIEAVAHGDDCGSAYPSLTFIHGIQILVDRKDLQKARKLLARMEAQHRRELESLEPEPADN